MPHPNNPSGHSGAPTDGEARIVADSFVTLHYRLHGPMGDVINTFGDKPATLSLGTGEISPGVEQCLIGLTEGAHQVFELAEGAAFGAHNPERVQWVARKLLSQLSDPDETYTVGDVVQFPTPDGEATFAGAIRQIRPDAMLFDFNHPLAGQPVTLEVQVVGIL